MKSTRYGLLSMITHALILALSFSGTLVTSNICLTNYTLQDSRQPWISFKALPYPYVLNNTNGTLWCEGRSKTAFQSIPAITRLRFRRNGKTFKSIDKDSRSLVTVFSQNVTVNNIGPLDIFECIIEATRASCNIDYVQYKVFDPSAVSFTQQPQESYALNWLQFTLGAKAFPHPKLQWILNETMISNENNSRVTLFRQPLYLVNKTFHVKSAIRIHIAPGPKYPFRIQCAARNSLVLNYTFSRIVYARYILLKVTNITSNMAKVRWGIIVYSNSSYFNNISECKISLKNHLNESYEITTPGNRSEEIFNNLSVHTAYDCVIVCLVGNGDRLISDLVIFTTLARIPKPLVEIIGTTAKTAVVQWEKIATNKEKYGDLLGYKIALNNRIVRTTNTTRVTLEGLSPKTIYNVTIRAYNQIEDGLSSDVKNFVTSALVITDSKKDSLTLIISLTVGSILLVILVALVVLKIVNYRTRKTKPRELEMQSTNNPFDVNLRILFPERHNAGINAEEEHSIWELPRERLTILDKTLGGGYFGIVKEGIFIRPTDNDEEDQALSVAIKTLKNNNCTIEWEELLKELEILEYINEKGHPNIVGLIGACTQTVPILIIMEYCQEGNLRDLLIKSRVNMDIEPDYKNIYSLLTERQLISISSDIAGGMAFLYQLKVVHRDIASRNILLDENLAPKIGDFGLARKIDTSNLYIVKKNKMLPVKWMALESLELGKFTPASDTWSYGILLWEICTLGKEPYPQVSPYDIFEYLMYGNRMKRPVHCSDEIFTLMESCWHSDPEMRPKFREIHESLQNMLADQETTYINVIERCEEKDDAEVLQTSVTNSTVAPENSYSGQDSGISDTSL